MSIWTRIRNWWRTLDEDGVPGPGTPDEKFARFRAMNWDF